MPWEGISERCARATEEFNRDEQRDDGVHIAGSLHAGLTVLRDAFYLRVRDDVERLVGRDSMLIPASKLKSEMTANNEIEVYQIVESAAVVAEHGYVKSAGDWYTQWLTRLRLDAIAEDEHLLERIEAYRDKASDQRRLDFTNALVTALPQARQAPLVLFRLAPLSVQIITALAFGDTGTAVELRRRQINHLPAIGDCHHCRGEVFESGEQCHGCGNPMWKPEWLNAD